MVVNCVVSVCGAGKRSVSDVGDGWIDEAGCTDDMDCPISRVGVQLKKGSNFTTTVVTSPQKFSTSGRFPAGLGTHRGQCLW
jgi:hypothetical protein